jgi:hypothetical protein
LNVRQCGHLTKNKKGNIMNYSMNQWKNLKMISKTVKLGTVFALSLSLSLSLSLNSMP